MGRDLTPEDPPLPEALALANLASWMFNYYAKKEPQLLSDVIDNFFGYMADNEADRLQGKGLVDMMTLALDLEDALSRLDASEG